MLWRGFLLLLISQFFFLLGGYGMNVVLARVLGPEGYGTFGVVYSLLMVFELLVVAGIPNALQRFVGERPAQAYALHKVMFRWQLIYTILVFVGAVVCAPVIVGFLRDEEITWLLRIATIDVLFFAFYWYFNGLQIGLKNFGKQTLIASTYSVSKFIFVSGLVLAGFSVAGAFVGNILGSVCGLGLGLWFTRLDKSDAGVPKSDLIHFIVNNIVYSIALNLFFYVDLWFVKYHAAKSVVGFYNAASTLGRFPYFLSIALTGALLPSLSYAIGQGRKAEIERIIRQSLRAIMILTLPVMVLVATSASPVVRLFFGEGYEGAGGVLQRLIIGLSMLAILVVLNTIAMAKNGMKGCTVIVLALVLLDVLLNAILVPRGGPNGAALATTVTMIIGVIISSLHVLHHFKVFMSIGTVVRILAASLVILIISGLVRPDNNWELIVKFASLLSIYVLLLRSIGEISHDDVVSIRAAIVSRTNRTKRLASESLHAGV